MVESIQTTINTISDIENFINPEEKTLVVFDMDGTIVMGPFGMGGDAWFQQLEINFKQNKVLQYRLVEQLGLYKQIHELASREEDHVNFVEEKLKRYMTDKLNYLVYKIQNDFQPVEDKTINFINSIQQKTNSNAIVLTSRSVDVLDTTTRYLSNIKLKFSIDGISESFFVEEKGFKFGYKEGVICCEGRNKGEVLKHFLKLLPKGSVNHLIFVDDTYSKVKDVEDAFVESEISATSLFYRPNLADRYDYSKSCEYVKGLKDINFEEDFFWLV
ncbi:DUF2608 domain-containing protein [Candidatus Babeliales bacterium]|nr:DUF2608 domain-containing protein [Candidatus Babeliales bacterium]